MLYTNLRDFVQQISAKSKIEIYSNKEFSLCSRQVLLKSRVLRNRNILTLPPAVYGYKDAKDNRSEYTNKRNEMNTCRKKLSSLQETSNTVFVAGAVESSYRIQETPSSLCLTSREKS